MTYELDIGTQMWYNNSMARSYRSLENVSNNAHYRGI